MDKSHEAMEIAEEARQKEYRQPSFGGQIFMGSFNSSMLFPFPIQDVQDKEEGDLFIDKLGKYLESHLDPDAVEASREIPKDILQGLSEMGVFAMKIPKEYGGLGLSVTNYNRAVMKIASYCSSTSVLVSAHQSIGVPQPLIMFGTEEQKRKYFPGFRKGKISAFALTEIDVGSDPAKMAATADLSDDGRFYILNGEKLWCTNGTIADVIVVMAKTAPKIVKGKEKKQISAFILEMNTEGVEVVHRSDFMGLNAIYNGMIRFTNVKIPRENLIDEEGRGLAMALATINIGRLTLPAACTGVAKQMLSIARRWGKSRIQWGRPVGLHEAGKEKIAYIASMTFAMEALTLLTSAFADRANVDIRIEAAMAKYFCTEALWKITDMTMQLRGGRGYEKASSLKARGEPALPVERAMRDSRINTILEGSSEIMKLFLAREAIDPHLRQVEYLRDKKRPFKEVFPKILKTLGYYASWYSRQLFSKTPSYKNLGPLAEYFQFCERASKSLSRKLFLSIFKYREALEGKQMLLGRLMDIGSDLFVMGAVCSYAHSLVEKNPENKTPYTLADYFCQMTQRNVEENFKSLNSNDDKAMNILAENVIEGGITWLEEGIIRIGPEEL